MKNHRRNVFAMCGAEAKKFFMRETNYFSTMLPPYYRFANVLTEVDERMAGHDLEYFCVSDPQQYKDINYIITNSKGGYNWRPLQLMHPAFYVQLVNLVTEEENWNYIKSRRKSFRANRRVICASKFVQAGEMAEDRPLEIINWWQQMEQGSIRLALDYDYVLYTDIANCYETISEKLVTETLEGELGRRFSRLLRYMSDGDFRGIPQGSCLMDFLAELMLGYIDYRLAAALENHRITSNYLVLRYRDDYRIFTKDPKLAEDITRFLTKVLAEYGMKLNVEKTQLYDDIVTAAVKPDKVYWNEHRSLLYINDDGEVGEPSLQRHLMAIREMSKLYPNGGSVQSALVDIYRKRIFQMDYRPQNLDQIVSIVVDIAMHNSRTFYVSAAILSKLIPLYNERNGRRVLEKILKKFEKVPNKDYFEICLQRITAKQRRKYGYHAPLCKAMRSPNAKIWNSEWLSFTITDAEVIDRGVIATMETTVPIEEVYLFSPFDSND
ncbi:RNA-directed DNA polymerase [Candidatus Saccharibacteria bacterium]|nr:RNA-directed DNA polymerase [Candidatus Saccharibacteria bacterium]